jgi:chromosome partitioning protein
MNILIGNRKGGSGKSTVTLLLANYLAGIKHSKVTVVDLDEHQSISHKAAKAKILENEPLYEVITADIKHAALLLQALNRIPHQIVLIDLSNQMDDDSLISIFRAAQLVLCPFNYDEFTVQATLLFARITQKLNGQVPIVFIPNRIKTNIQYETRQEIDRLLTSVGPVSKSIADRVEFQRLCTVHTPASLYPSIHALMDQLYETYILPYDL